jgi:hypothetical protein
MEPVVRQDILIVLDKAVKAIRAGDVGELNALSNQTIHNASIYQDEDSISVAILVYALSKIVQRFIERGESMDGVSTRLAQAAGKLRTLDVDGFRDDIHHLFEVVSGMDRKIRLYIEEVIEKARVKKGGKMYEHGLSIARTAEVLGISQWELQSYIGKTALTEISHSATSDVRKKLDLARSLFT